MLTRPHALLRLVPLRFVAVHDAFLAGCPAPAEDDSTVGSESNYTGEGGVDARSNEDVDVAPFSLADATTPAKLRFSYDGATAVDALQTDFKAIISGSDRRFRLQGATPIAGGKPTFYVEFGRGAALIAKTTYDCASGQAVVVIIEKDEKKNMTAVAGGPSRACQVVIDELEVAPRLNPNDKPTWNVVGHVEAEVGPRDDAAGQTKRVRATFAGFLFDSSQ